MITYVHVFSCFLHQHGTMFTEDGTYAVRKLKTTSNQLHLLYDASSTMNPKWENTPGELAYNDPGIR